MAGGGTCAGWVCSEVTRTGGQCFTDFIEMEDVTARVRDIVPVLYTLATILAAPPAHGGAVPRAQMLTHTTS